MLFSLARGAASVAQKNVRMKEMMIAGRAIRAGIRLGKWVHLRFHFSFAADWRELTPPSCGNLINKDPLSRVFVAGATIRHELELT